jgi:3-hydroxyacyl-CoA dehydrogenase
MEKILVVGAGFMGSGIAQVCAQKGNLVFLTDAERSAIDNAINGIRWSLGRLAEKGSIKESPETVLKRIIPQYSIQKANEADWIIEAVPELEDLKKNLFAELDSIAPSKTIIASNTSSIPISSLAAATGRPDRVLGLHFFGPVPLMRLVEVVKGELTSDEVFERGAAFAVSLGKIPVRVTRDIPGFVMNRIFTAAFREALDLVDKGIVSPAEVDIGMREGYGWKAGPFEIADNAGLDTIELIGKALASLGEGQLSPKGDLLTRMLKEGKLGKKTGKGFYCYDSAGRRLPGQASFS